MMLSPVAQRMPAEWEQQDAVWLSWPPPQSSIWVHNKAETDPCFASLAAVISRYQLVRINADVALWDRIEKALAAAGADPAAVELYPHPVNDVWCRDHGPLFVQDVSGRLIVTDWGFNAWGGKYAPCDLDNAVPRHIASTLSLPRVEYPMILEGGAIEVDGAGLLLTTEAVLLNPNRNPALSRAAQESMLQSALGVKNVIWLGEGIAEDDTDGHIDNITRFFAPSAVVTMVEPDREDPNHQPLADNLQRLLDYRTADGGKLEVVALPAPNPLWVEEAGVRRRLPASYANFLILNDVVIVPVFGDSAADDRAVGVLTDCFPGRRIEPFDSRFLLLEGGAVHCLSQQQPSAGASK